MESNNQEKQKSLVEDIKPLNYLLKQEFPEQKFFVDDLIPQDSIILLSAPPASMKTWFSLELASSITTGKKFLGEFKVHPANILILDEESGQRQLQHYLNMLGMETTDSIYYHCGHGITLNQNTVNELLPLCYDLDIKLIIIDSLTRIHNADENSSKEMSAVFNLLGQLKLMHISCLILCHERKSNGYPNQRRGDAIRGSSDILAACDAHIQIVRKERSSYITVYQTKTRGRVEPSPFKARLLSIDKNHNEWQYAGLEQSKEAKQEQMKNSILNTIAENPGLNKKQVYEEVKCADLSISRDKTFSIIQELIDNEDVKTKSGKGSEKLLYCERRSEND